MFSVQAVKSISVFLLKNGTYEPLYTLSDQRFNVHYYFIRTNSYKKITRKSLSDEVFWQPRPQRPDSQLPGRPLPLAACSPAPAVVSPAPQCLRRDLLQEPRGLYWLHFVSPWPFYSIPWLQRGSPGAGKEHLIRSEPPGKGPPRLILDWDLLPGQWSGTRGLPSVTEGLT